VTSEATVEDRIRAAVPGGHAEIVAREPLVGGAQSAHVERARVRVGSRRLELVYKRTWQAEVVALEAVRRMPTPVACAPRLLGAGLDPVPAGMAADHPLRPAWIVVPWYSGRRVARRALPASLFACLAVLHAHHRNRAHGADGLVRVSAGWFRDGLCREHVLPRLRTRPGLDDAAAWVAAVADHPTVAAVLASVPATLVHGDCHPGNILAGRDGAVLIDWANARWGPAMLDLANLCRLGSPALAAYRAAWSRVTGAPPDEADLRREFWYATLQVNIQYLPYAADHLRAASIARMCERGRAAVAALERDLGMIRG
jgi:aminoglycoside phosphotransferase (APT) family kinase protein